MCFLCVLLVFFLLVLFGVGFSRRDPLGWLEQRRIGFQRLTPGQGARDSGETQLVPAADRVGRPGPSQEPVFAPTAYGHFSPRPC